MPVPPKRRSQSKGKRGRSHAALVKPVLIKCPKCSRPTRPHQVCPACGSYKGKERIKLKMKKKKENK
ncbi:MAG: 50S ribosomal protein L32 [Candidatus Buchananbacteria bacterium RIFCSPHIGHO2_02_FULL_45_11b]|uniref:Large ribosomal subunit protein bL32 n=4 Tax=Candidatus Buchananiibacteriota TaxID=1817903 RepID=A0A1G1Y5M2_9BACT|nr:MAG: 50S ribosomal protein L32 [Candidatus Buchananbacteria bacterium RIFCSPHIGHO2_01_FULL_46_12]OGY52609.1 MAG: 50S ribosomal protein L32 [Candidatus Buchananbacteria bacterium RIFCSPHIGHO2_02_FULL_45_11b]OGY54419.1 MAG: 50S ribosomal protein L32 [Candidatus Buchananbacteria bacterium RIFCSPLOWO2_01_FULL_45_31]OGY58358.1 MAG: 50S ribosomal protein L32 [Candidatus Buchananbacteria bacterium RIFCSPLOWO2_02_FULL_46_11b]